MKFFSLSLSNWIFKHYIQFRRENYAERSHNATAIKARRLIARIINSRAANTITHCIPRGIVHTNEFKFTIHTQQHYLRRQTTTNQKWLNSKRVISLREGRHIVVTLTYIPIYMYTCGVSHPAAFLSLYSYPASPVRELCVPEFVREFAPLKHTHTHTTTTLALVSRRSISRITYSRGRCWLFQAKSIIEDVVLPERCVGWFLLFFPEEWLLGGQWEKEGEKRGSSALSMTPCIIGIVGLSLYRTDGQDI